ncbi:hypothetical protein GQR58_006668 [Nymphon striatum]|nr:hypothetical protein GQR58_006668 [Nymphon striatum]
MPAQTTSADKKQLAQQARREAALKRASNRPVRRRAPAAVSAQSSQMKSDKTSMASSQPEVVSSAPEKELEEHFLSPDYSCSEAISNSINTDDASEEIEALCEIADTNPGALGTDLSNVRQLCRNRRKALSSKGKAAVPGKNSVSRSGSNAARAMAYAAGQINGRDLAKLRRREMANKGRGDTPVSRPSGRVRPNAAPPKVETGTTLSGQEVSGTQVERTASVTGNESGTCRAITGTEYVGTEQFATFCGTQPEPNPPKVGMSVTGAGEKISGTEIGRSEKVTGDENW